MRAGCLVRYGLAAGLCLAAGAAPARPASCYTSDNGAYPCDFQPTDRAGSFTISAPGKPTVRIEVEEPGVAAGFVTLGGREVFLPGHYRLNRSRGCWVNDETKDDVCAQ